MPPPESEQENASNVFMNDDGLTQHDSDIMIEEEQACSEPVSHVSCNGLIVNFVL